MQTCLKNFSVRRHQFSGSVFTAAFKLDFFHIRTVLKILPLAPSPKGEGKGEAMKL